MNNIAFYQLIWFIERFGISNIQIIERWLYSTREGRFDDPSQDFLRCQQNKMDGKMDSVAEEEEKGGKPRRNWRKKHTGYKIVDCGSFGVSREILQDKAR